MRSDTIIKQEGFNALKEKPGVIEMERFIVLINREIPGDSTVTPLLSQK